MKSAAQLEEFFNQKTYCELCADFKEELKSVYQTKGLMAAQKFCVDYDNFLCPALDKFLHFNN